MNNKSSFFKGLFITVGVVVSVAAVVAVLYRIFTKYFKITLDCGDCHGDCDCDCCPDSDDCAFDDCDIFGNDPDAEPVD